MRKLCLHPRFMLPSSFNYVTLVPDSRAHIGSRQSNGSGRPAAHQCLGTNVERCRLRYGKTEWTWKTVGAGLLTPAVSPFWHFWGESSERGAVILVLGWFGA